MALGLIHAGLMVIGNGRLKWREVLRGWGFGQERNLRRCCGIYGHTGSASHKLGEVGGWRVDGGRAASCPSPAGLHLGVVPGLVALPFEFALLCCEGIPRRARRD